MFRHENDLSETSVENNLARRRIWGSRKKIRFEIGFVVLPQIEIKAKFREFGSPPVEQAQIEKLFIFPKKNVHEPAIPCCIFVSSLQGGC